MREFSCFPFFFRFFFYYYYWLRAASQSIRSTAQFRRSPFYFFCSIGMVQISFFVISTRIGVSMFPAGIMLSVVPTMFLSRGCCFVFKLYSLYFGWLHTSTSFLCPFSRDVYLLTIHFFSGANNEPCFVLFNSVPLVFVLEFSNVPFNCDWSVLCSICFRNHSSFFWL